MNKIGPYEVVDGPFQGGFGEVYRVFDTDTGDEFALKTLKDAFLSTSRRVKRFRREIELWMRIPVHPNVVRAIRAFDHGERPYVLIEWIAGGNLAERMGALQPIAALEVLRQICAGMAHIHEQGLVHSDLKPSNVMMWSGKSPQITDFGFARMTDEAEGGLIGGTERYMAPELAGAAPTPASDIYAAGVLFLEVLAPHDDGAFGVRETQALARRMCSGKPADRLASFSEAERGLSAILARSPLPPGVGWRPGERLTYWEKNVAGILKHRDRFQSAMSELAAGRRAAAKAALEQIVAEKPDMVDARIALADILMEDGDLFGAIEQARAASRAAELPARRLTIAGLLAEAGLDEEAEEILAGLKEETGLRGGVWDLRARMAERKGDLSEAISLFRRSIEHGGGARSRFGLAGALREAGLIDEAIAEYGRVGKTDRELGLKVALRLARLYVDLGRHDEALRELRQALKLDLGKETEASIYAELAFVYKSQGLYEAALASYRKSLELAPGSQAVLDGIRMVEERLDAGPDRGSFSGAARRARRSRSSRSRR